MMVMNTFLRTGICKFQRAGIGSTQIPRSIIKLKATEVYSSVVSSRHQPPGTGLQRFDRGMQLVMKTMRKATK